MKILFCTPAPLTKSLGAAKVVVELAEEMRELGWDCRLLCPSDLDNDTDILAGRKRFPENLRRYLKEHATQYNIVDFDHEYLAYARAEFSPNTLFVARSVLLVHHLETIPIPTCPNIKSQLGTILKAKQRQHERQKRIYRAQIAFENADLINVSNDDDKAELLRCGIPNEKTVVIPYGISHSRRLLFDQVSSELPKHPVVAFVGTFDFRKGAREFPEIVRAVTAALPNVKFRFFGSKGLFQTEAEIRACFSKNVQGNLEMMLSYVPEELPRHLSSCSLGVFPSYMEGFPFGVLEMMSSSLPVIAYDAPGPPMMLKPKHLVERGDWQGVSRKIIDLLQNNDDLLKERVWAKQHSQQFSWRRAAVMTQELYLEKLNMHGCFDIQNL